MIKIESFSVDEGSKNLNISVCLGIDSFSILI